MLFAAVDASPAVTCRAKQGHLAVNCRRNLMSSLAGTVVLDSNAMTYLDQATNKAYSPDSDSSGLREDRVALFRLYLHLEEIPWIVPAIEKEYERIKEESRLRSHTLLAY